MTEPQMNDAQAEELPPPAKFLFGNKAYDLIKLCALIVFPALGTLYFGIAQIWGLPHAQDVVGTIVVIDTFLGALIGVVANQYNNSDAKFDGAINVVNDQNGDTSHVHLQADRAAVAGKDEVLLKVNRT